MKHPRIQVKARVVGTEKIRSNERLQFDHESLEGANFSGKKLSGFSAHGSKFIECQFEKMRIESTSFGSGRVVSEYIGCSFDGSHLRMGPGGYVRFERCTFHNTDIRDWFCFCVELVECTFSGKMRKVVFNGTPRPEDQPVVGRKRNEFRDNDFSAAKLEDVSFRTGVDLKRQKMPVGAEYLYLPDAESAVRQARREILEWTDMELRRLSMILINIFESEIQAGQRQLLLCVENYPRECADPVFSLLRRFA